MKCFVPVAWGNPNTVITYYGIMFVMKFYGRSLFVVIFRIYLENCLSNPCWHWWYTRHVSLLAVLCCSVAHKNKRNHLRLDLQGQARKNVIWMWTISTHLILFLDLHGLMVTGWRKRKLNCLV